MIEVREITAGRGDICREILATLPHWFGIAESNAEYARDVESLPMAVAFDGNAAVGFVAIKSHHDMNTEIHVLGVRPELHRKGIGRRLLGWAEDQAHTAGHKLMSVKTLSPADPDEGYRLTRAFYFSLGFLPLEDLPLWDPDNPSIILVKPL